MLNNVDILITLSVFIFICFSKKSIVNCADELDFWEPTAKFDTRRGAENLTHLQDKKYSVYNRGRAINKIDHRNDKVPINTTSTKKEKRPRVPKNRGREKELKLDHQNNRSRTSSHDRALRHGHNHETTKKWPKVQRNRSKGKYQRQTMPSTRLTPMYFMQQTEGNDQKHNEVTSREDLSPYSIAQQMHKIAEKFPEANFTIDVIGRTAEYNDIVLLKITEQKNEMGKYFRAEESKYIDEVPEKKIVFIVHGLAVMGFRKLKCLNNKKYFDKLLSYYLAHLDKFDIFLIPLANPDAVNNVDMFWNKNNSPQSACSGVALDRNFDVAWNLSKVISSCNPHYPGPTPFSEAETQAVRDVFHRYSHKIIAYFHVHAGSFDYESFKGDAVLYSKGYTDSQSDDDKYIDMKGEIEEAMKNASFQVLSVTVDTLYNWYGKVSGTSVDYASTVYGIPYAMELVMQLYQNIGVVWDTEEQVDHNALTEIWRRIIEVLFNNIWKSIHTNDNK